jgi:hypothetical protein
MPPLAPAEGDVVQGALVRHPGAQRFYLVEGDLMVVSNAALVGTEDVVVLHPIALEQPVLAVVELDREVHDQLVLGLGEDLPQVPGQVHEVRRLLELLLGHLVRVRFRCRRRCLQRIGHGLRVA